MAILSITRNNIKSVVPLPGFSCPNLSFQWKCPRLTHSLHNEDVYLWQHLYTFTNILKAPKGQGKRQLDCAGVVLATLATCYHVAQHHPQHSDLAQCRLQVCSLILVAVSWLQPRFARSCCVKSRVMLDGCQCQMSIFTLLSRAMSSGLRGQHLPL